MDVRGFARVAAVAGLAAYLAAVTAGAQFSLDPPGFLYDVWYSAAPILAGSALAFGVALYVGRWFVLLAAMAPLAVLGGLELAGHTAPWEDAGAPLSGLLEGGRWWVYAWFLVFPLVLGVLIRHRWTTENERQVTRMGG
jgi:hypothetical protein